MPDQKVASRWHKTGLSILVALVVIIPVGFWLTDAVQRARWAAQRSSDK